MIRADLHIHSTISDGSLTLGQILECAKAADLTHVSITDHDTTAGVKKAVKLGAAMGLAVIPGVEFSAYDYDRRIRAHILGYGMKDLAPVDVLGEDLLRRRHANSLRQIDVLKRLGYDITAEDVMAYAGRHIYKQHIMHALVEKGYAGELFGATFMKLFKSGGQCDFDIAYIDARDAVRAVKEAGGFAVLAHPGQQGNYTSIPALARVGLDGLELCHHANTSDDRARIAEIARIYGLMLTGGSDCHGLYEANSPTVGSYLCPAETIEKFEEMTQAC